MRISETESINPAKHLDAVSRESGARKAGAKGSSAGSVRDEQVRKDEFSAEKQREHLDKTQVQKALEEFEELNRFIDKGFDFQIHDGTERIMVEVIDRQTEEIVREIPPEEILDIVAGLKEIVGLLVDEQL